MIQLNRLTKVYPATVNKNRLKMRALDSVDLEINPGEVVGLLGPNGAGKTTLIRILATLVLPTAGDAYVAGFDVVKQPRGVRSAVGLVAGGERAFYWRLSLKNNLEFFGALQGLGPHVLRDRIEEVLARVGLQEGRNLKFMKCSTGMRKKLNIARALLNDPLVYLMDEPTSGIDPLSAKDIRNSYF
ncbi:MAG: ABC transporter ATP-binding protein [Firmicutes bacterium]|nr:ABC transporter ATP-binding protein [Bacillota bacterium]